MKESTFPKASQSTQQRREHIILAATDIIAKEGLTTLSVRTVAKRAGCSRGLVEHYFRNKAALLIAANAWADEVYLSRVETAVGTKTGLEALEVRLRNLLPYNEAVHDEWKVRIAFWHQGNTISSVEQSNSQSFHAVYSAILADMRQAQAQGEIASAIPVIVTSELLLFTVIGLCTSCLNNAKLRHKASLDRRMLMFMAFLKTANVSALEVGDPEVDY